MVLAIVFFLLVFLDQITKAVAFALIGTDEPVLYWLGKMFGFDTLINKGMSFGIGADQPWALPLFIALTSLAIVVMLFFVFRLRPKHRFLRTSLVLIMSGAGGNLIDRIVIGGVRDLIYMDFGFTCFSNNIADILIFFGAIFFILALLFFDEDALFRLGKNRKKEKEQLEEAAHSLVESAKTEEEENDSSKKNG